MSLLLWYPFTQDGYNRGAIEDNHLSPTLNNTGLLGKCGFANKTTLSTNLDLGGSYSPLNTSSTMTAWIKMNFDECKAVIASTSVNSTANTPTSCVIGSTSYGGLGICWQSNNIYNGGNRAELSSIRLFGYTRGTNSSGSTVQVTTTAKNITFGKWHHIALVTNKETKKISFYFDGSLVSENSYNSMTNITTGRSFGLNRNQVYGGNGPGALLPVYYNDVRFYNEVLSVMEIKELSRGLYVHYAFNDIGNESTTNLVTGVVAGGRTTVDTTNLTVTTTGADADTYFQLKFSEALVQGETYTIQCYGENIGPGLQFTFGMGSQTTSDPRFTIKDGWNTYTFVATANCSKAQVLFDDTSRTGWANRATFSKFQVEKKDHATPYTPSSRSSMFYDDSGNGNDGVGHQMSLTTSSNCGEYSAVFNGNYSYIELANTKPALPNEPYTIAFWINPAENGVRDVIFGNHANTSQTFNIERHTGNQLRIYYHGDDAIGYVAAATMLANTWTHIAITFDGTTCHVYKNGVSVYSKALSTTLNCTNANWKIGSDYRAATTSTEATRFKGKISDFRIYVSALSAADIKTLYESQAAVDKNNNIYTNEIIEQQHTGNMVNATSWEQNGIHDNSGIDANDMMTRIRSKYIPVLPDATYCYGVQNSSMTVRGVHYYNASNIWISYDSGGGNKTTPSNCAYVRWVIQNTNASTSVPVANIATYGPYMVYQGQPTPQGLDEGTEVQVNKDYTITTKDICEGHDSGFFIDGTATGNQFYEI